MMLFCRNFFVSNLILLKSHPYCFYSLPEIETIRPFVYMCTRYKSIRYKIPELIKDNYLPKIVLEKMDTHSYAGFTKYAKTYTISKYKTTCKTRNCYVCKKLTNTTV